MNALDERALNSFIEILNSVEKNKELRVLIITGKGDKAFCVGIDLKDKPVYEMDIFEFKERIDQFQKINKSLREMYIPTIAAVNGYAVGAGGGIAFSCDFRIASENAVFGAVFINIGLVPADGETYFLPRIVGESIAKQMIMTGKQYNAQEALKIGLVEEVVPLDKLMETAINKAKILMSKSPIALYWAKKLINNAFDDDLGTALEKALLAQKFCAESEEHKKAVEDFRRKHR